MQANSPDSNDRVHIVLKRAKPAKHNEEHDEPPTDTLPEKEEKNQQPPHQEEVPKQKAQTVRKVQEVDESESSVSSEPVFDGDEEPLDDFTYDSNSF